MNVFNKAIFRGELRLSSESEISQKICKMLSGFLRSERISVSKLAMDNSERSEVLESNVQSNEISS